MGVAPMEAAMDITGFLEAFLVMIASLLVFMVLWTDRTTQEPLRRAVSTSSLSGIEGWAPDRVHASAPAADAT